MVAGVAKTKIAQTETPLLADMLLTSGLKAALLTTVFLYHLTNVLFL